MPVIEIAQKLGVPYSSMRHRVSKLRKKGIELARVNKIMRQGVNIPYEVKRVNAPGEIGKRRDEFVLANWDKMSSQQIAKHLDISERTLRCVASRLRKKGYDLRRRNESVSGVRSSRTVGKPKKEASECRIKFSPEGKRLVQVDKRTWKYL